MKTTVASPNPNRARSRAPQPTLPDRRLPIGAELLPSGGAHFRVWAPRARRVAVEFTAPESARAQVVALDAEPDGYFSGCAPEAVAGAQYRYHLDRGAFPDPASRFQPDGPHGPSQIVDPRAFRWTDSAWRGVTRHGQVIYELHIGTFTREGTWRAAQERLPQLTALGITVVEVMPVAEFPGKFGWGYDGVDLFAPTRLYGVPDDFRAFVDQAHACGLGVILDVVYNHVGPDGNYLKEFSPYYFTDRHRSEWGEAINFDGDHSEPVREFFIANAGYWIDEFHLDGLRLDATHQVFDASPDHILAALARQARAAAGGRSTLVIAENESQQSQLARTPADGGFGLDAIWNDDFHHSARVALTGRHEAYYSDYRGRPQEFIAAAKRGFLYQGQWYTWQKKRRGTPTTGLRPEQFVQYIQNHDQIANSLRGLRMHQLTSPGRYRAITALLLISPATPMLFQGQEFAASAPFLYFAGHHPELAKLVAAGRGEFLRQFPGIGSPGAERYLCDPAAEETFWRCKLDWAERERHQETYALHRDLLALRRMDPVFAHPRAGGIDGAVLGSDLFVLRFFGSKGADRLLVVNLGREARLDAAPEPLLAPPEGWVWRTRWLSEDPRYGGSGAVLPESEPVWRISGETAAILFQERDERGEADPPH